MRGYSIKFGDENEYNVGPFNVCALDNKKHIPPIQKKPVVRQEM